VMQYDIRCPIARTRLHVPDITRDTG
jgi:hypothetical protein